MSEHFYFFIQASIFYFIAIFSIKLFMRNREAFDLQRPLNMWNMFLAIFSTAGAIFQAPEFFGILFNGGFRASYCILGDMMSGQNGLWTWFFMLSKLAEFVDTFFIVLRKKPLMFLHWYHHILTLLYGTFSFPDAPAFNRWGVYLNFCVHSFMYSYYFLKSVGVKIPGAVSKAITTGQILQFVISIAVLVCVGVEHYVMKSLGDCTFHVPSFWLASFMDTTYLILFVNFFLHAYVFRGGKAKYGGGAKKDEKKKQ